jgi:hypothetical protein
MGNWMNRRNAGLALLLGPLAFGAAPLATFAQQMGKTPRVGILLPGLTSAPSIDPNVAAFEEALRALGWVDGRNVCSSVAMLRDIPSVIPVSQRNSCA